MCALMRNTCAGARGASCFHFCSSEWNIVHGPNSTPHGPDGSYSATSTRCMFRVHEVQVWGASRRTVSQTSSSLRCKRNVTYFKSLNMPSASRSFSPHGFSFGTRLPHDTCSPCCKRFSVSVPARQLFDLPGRPSGKMP